MAGGGFAIPPGGQIHRNVVSIEQWLDGWYSILISLSLGWVVSKLPGASLSAEGTPAMSSGKRSRSENIEDKIKSHLVRPDSSILAGEYCATNDDLERSWLVFLNEDYDRT